MEEQRLYDITKLRRQFQDILRVGIPLLDVESYDGDALGSQYGNRLSTEQGSNDVRET